MVYNEETLEISPFRGCKEPDEDMAPLVLNERFSDIEFQIGDKIIPAHKIILASRSSYFAAKIDKRTSREIPIDAPLRAVEAVLKYIYTGSVSVPFDVDLLCDILNLAEEFSLTPLTTFVCQKLQFSLNTRNVCQILDSANSELKEKCLEFIAQNIEEIRKNDTLQTLSQKSMVELLKHPNFPLSDIEVFKVVAEWCKINEDRQDLVKNCVRFSYLTRAELLSVVRPSELIKDSEILDLITEIEFGEVTRQDGGPVEDSSNTESEDEDDFHSLDGEKKEDNFLSPVDEEMHEWNFSSSVELLSGETGENIFASHVINNGNIVLKLDRPYLRNHIQMKFPFDEKRIHSYIIQPCTSYSYYIEVSLDNKKWTKVIDYTRFPCHSLQSLYFNAQYVQFIKIVGTAASRGKNFVVESLETFFSDDIPETVDGIIRPEYNVATAMNHASCIQGHSPDGILNGNPESRYTWHKIASECCIKIKLAQPYLISSIKLLLHPEAEYKYCVETSTDNKNWDVVVNETQDFCTGWQQHVFEERIVGFVRIIGTTCSKTDHDNLYCVHLVCDSRK